MNLTNYKRSGKMFAAALAPCSDNICKSCHKSKSATIPSILMEEYSNGDITEEELNRQIISHKKMYQCTCLITK